MGMAGNAGRRYHAMNYATPAYMSQRCMAVESSCVLASPHSYHATFISTAVYTPGVGREWINLQSEAWTHHASDNPPSSNSIVPATDNSRDSRPSLITALLLMFSAPCHSFVKLSPIPGGCIVLRLRRRCSTCAGRGHVASHLLLGAPCS
jgi:hypothetical protein